VCFEQSGCCQDTRAPRRLGHASAVPGDAALRVQHAGAKPSITSCQAAPSFDRRQGAITALSAGPLHSFRTSSGTPCPLVPDRIARRPPKGRPRPPRTAPKLSSDTLVPSTDPDTSSPSAKSLPTVRQPACPTQSVCADSKPQHQARIISLGGPLATRQVRPIARGVSSRSSDPHGALKILEPRWRSPKTRRAVQNLCVYKRRFNPCPSAFEIGRHLHNPFTRHNRQKSDRLIVQSAGQILRLFLARHSPDHCPCINKACPLRHPTASAKPSAIVIVLVGKSL